MEWKLVSVGLFDDLWRLTGCSSGEGPAGGDDEEGGRSRREGEERRRCHGGRRRPIVSSEKTEGRGETETMRQVLLWHCCSVKGRL